MARMNLYRCDGCGYVVETDIGDMVTPPGWYVRYYPGIQMFEPKERLAEELGVSVLCPGCVTALAEAVAARKGKL